MKLKDEIASLFERLEGSFDVHETPTGHQKRFLEKLNQQQPKTVKPTINYWKWGSIAAAIALLVVLGGSLFAPQSSTEADLASVSPELEQTQSFFTATITTEIEKLKQFESPEHQQLIQDALIEVEKLETEYQLLKKDLVESGYNKQVVNAMILNFQSRITILENVSETLTAIKTLKNNTNETYL
ncbi:hypothetical protein [Marinirhabdus gelatinilytica]|uniref:DUF4179 domain-containing protein n=1 Tax=Marinirhabdus gelatinilytica TaxID=1703343 RepID=A0A370QAD0_9FLAO|nr:hypothetical protein [Marinirhabdus gelatinilytica]RDK85335.1 hypothetical protein C8D94_103159 [Marinirhabdus gelatinilytica]